MKFLAPNYSCFQNPWLGDYRPQIPVLCLLSSTEFVESLLAKKIPGYATASAEPITWWTKDPYLLPIPLAWRRACAVIAYFCKPIPSLRYYSRLCGGTSYVRQRFECHINTNLLIYFWPVVLQHMCIFIRNNTGCFLAMRQIRCVSYVCHTLHLHTQNATLLRSKESIASIAPVTVEICSQIRG